MYYLKCKYRDTVFLPYIAISNNIDFLCKKEPIKECRTADNIKCEATEIREINLLSDEAIELVKNLYNLDIFSFLCKWYKSDSNLTSLHFVKINLKKEIYGN